MRALYIVSLFPCWSETFIVREILALRRAGVDVRVLSLKRPSERLVQPEARQLLGLVAYAPEAAFVRVAREVIAAPRVQVRLLARIVSGLALSPVALAKSLVTWWRALAVAAELRGSAIDILHAHWATYPSTAAWILSETLAVPFSFTSHAHDIFVENQLLRLKLAKSAFSVTISQFNRDLLTRRAGPQYVRNLHVIHCGVFCDDLPYLPTERRRGRILSVARLEEIKGLQYLIEACAALRANGLDVVCDIVGEGRCRPHLEDLISRHRLADSVRLHGAMDQANVQVLLASASVFALPSVVTQDGDQDGIPVGLMEAMAVGVPVVSTFVSGIPELVQNGVNGLLVPARDPVALAEAIARLIRDPNLAVSMAAAARHTIEESFDASRETQKLVHLFQRAVQPTRAPHTEIP